MTTAQLEEEIARLGPWHHDIQVTPEVNTAIWKQAPQTYPESFGPVSTLDDGWRQSVIAKLLSVYPNGLEGRSVLDCGCNCAASLLWAKELGAGDCFGFDLRDHWIDQARFLLEHYMGPTDGIRVETCGLYDLPQLGLEPFDVTFFHGVFYHLRDPVHGTQIAADLTNETIFLNTATKAKLPDGMLVAGREYPENLLAGDDHLMWFPTGPAIIGRILKSCGFMEAHLLSWDRELGGQGREELGRLEIVGSKIPGLLAEGYSLH